MMLIGLLVFVQACGVLKWSEVKRANQAAEIRGTTADADREKSTSEPAANKTTKSSTAANSGASTVNKKPVTTQSRTEKSMQANLLAVYADWKGTPYKWGGDSKKAIDCSAFMQRTFEEGFGKKLPRTTQEQYAIGKKIDKKALQTGDLVFFKTGSNTWHVGVYLSDNQFMHASVTYGVSVTDINNPYWKRRYIGARRIL